MKLVCHSQGNFYYPSTSGVYWILKVLGKEQQQTFLPPSSLLSPPSVSLSFFLSRLDPHHSTLDSYALLPFQLQQAAATAAAADGDTAVAAAAAAAGVSRLSPSLMIRRFSHSSSSEAAATATDNTENLQEKQLTTNLSLSPSLLSLPLNLPESLLIMKALFKRSCLLSFSLSPLSSQAVRMQQAMRRALFSSSSWRAIGEKILLQIYEDAAATEKCNSARKKNDKTGSGKF